MLHVRYLPRLCASVDAFGGGCRNPEHDVSTSARSAAEPADDSDLIPEQVADEVLRNVPCLGELGHRVVIAFLGQLTSERIPSRRVDLGHPVPRQASSSFGAGT